MANPGVANSSVTNLMPVQATFNTAGVCTGLIGPGGVVFSPPLSGNTENPSTLSMGGNLIATSNTLPTISAGFGTSPTITATNTVGFSIKVGTSPGSTGTISFPAAPNGWILNGWNITSAGTLYMQQTGYTTTSATITSLANTSGSATAFNANDVLIFTAVPF